MDAVTLYSTWPTLDSAAAAARTLVEQRLIACANILPGAVSVFRWEGEVQREDEVLMFAKTSARRATEARDAIIKLHPYSVPCVTAFAIVETASASAFLDWIAKETS